MYWLHTILVILLLNNVENFKLSREKILSHLHKQSVELEESISITRQSHRCYIGCTFDLPFNASLIMPETCNEVETDRPCEMIIIVDYETRINLFYFYTTSASLTIDNITYDSATEHLAYFGLTENSVSHIIDYTCNTSDFCEWKYAQEILPKVMELDYQPLLNLLLPKLLNSDGHPDITECYVNNTELANCSSGSCEFFQSVDNNYDISIIRRCIIFQDSFLEVGTVRHIPGPAKHDYNILSFTCDYDRCNDQSNEYEIKQIIYSNANEYINIYSLGTKLSLITIRWYFFLLFLMKYFK